ncbi:MAG: ATP-binding protein [Coriobacteriaceae bacterium]|nr:ATP-binding protein [Coriobacteriaceae bacterium]
MSLTTIAVFALAATVFMQQRLVRTTSERLSSEASIVAASLNSAPSHLSLLRRLHLDGTRVTLINADGDVLFDSDTDEAKMELHNDRPEVESALATGRGSAERASSTLGEVMLYQAVRLADGSVVRLAQGQAGFLSILGSLIAPVLLMVALGVAASVFVARRASRRIIAPLLEVDLDHPRRNVQTAYAEMVPMLERIESQRQELKRQMRVLADSDRMRREFTANITHELKTPLTAVSGYAELIANGLVTDEADLRDFGRRIYDEAGRLTALVNDILTLSNLDEAEREHGEAVSATLGSREPVDLPRMLESIEQRLASVAERAEVQLKLECEPAMVTGVPRLLDTLAYNLASNAIRYNQPGGTVTFACGMEPGKAGEEPRPFLRVSDTGIGIAPEEQEKVFERFYRVDKSRSKARGGTGLGLAIVKHAALYHNAELELESELGAGTTVTVRFCTSCEVEPVDGQAF